MMRTYRVHVNGKAYEVAVEEIGGAVSTAVSTPQPTASAAAAHVIPPGTDVVAAPMPGKILSIKVKPGQEVREGDLLLMLEAMKMENEIFCGRPGRVLEVKVAEGAYVDTGDALVVIG
ncbi:MAG: Glutaconyl-CoA decarboxylase subunit gamma [Planctomycetes bacterium ADurb.Bin126]|jgi:glutaconyl-CoA decarboxylase|nr:MAG: Glutaconyl-CoA decarboxylase subunit gamma [Planctomycetes bacterium ADurb.Bin126]